MTSTSGGLDPGPDPAGGQRRVTPEEYPRGVLLGPSDEAEQPRGAPGAAPAPSGRDERCDQLLASIFHELRTPLGTARHALQLLRSAASEGEQSGFALDVLERQLGLLGRLIDDLLDVSRIQRGKIRLERSRLDLTALARSALDDHRARFAARGVELRAELPHGALWVLGDGGRLTQALGNLLGNAAKFTPRGGRAVLTLEADGAARVASLRLRDTGLGFDPSLRDALFEPFRQAEPTAGRSEGGLGLGLAIARAVVELHGGSVEAWSDGLGRGAEFLLRLPLEPASAATGRT